MYKPFTAPDQMVKPVIHINGTSAAALLEELSNAYNALSNALEALAAASPNGRDYYPLGNEAFFKAQDQHRLRIAAIQGIMLDLEELSMHIDSQAAKRTT